MPSCGDTPTCLDRETSLVKIDFINEEGAAKDIILLSLKAIDNEDGFPEYALDTLSQLQVPLNPGSRTTTFLLEQASGIDTIAFSYTVVAQLISPECGLDAAFDQLDTLSTSFSQLEIISKSINELVEVNIEITL